MLAHIVFSRLLGEGRGERRFSRSVCVAIAGISASAQRDGAAELAELAPIGWPDGRTALAHLGIEHEQLDRQWLSRLADADRATVLPRRIVEAFFPASLWPWIEVIAALGPAQASACLERFCRREALRSAPVTRARPIPGPISAITIETVLAGGRRLFCALSTLRLRECDAGELAGWEYLPPRISATDLGALITRTDRSAPPLEVVRSAFVRLEAQLLQCRAGSAARRRALRDRILLALLVATGARIGALTRLRACDLEARHFFPDGTFGHALFLRPGKALAGFETRVKGIPPEVAGWLSEYLEALHAQAHTPLFPAWGDPRSRIPMHPASLSKILTGEPLRGGRQARPPLLPRPGNPHHGYSAHTLRHLAERLAYAAGRACIDRAEDPYSALTPQVYADALLDHEMRHDYLGYKDQATVTSRELLARDAAHGIWRIVRKQTLPLTPAQEKIAELRAARKVLLEAVDLETTSERLVLRRLLECARLTAAIDDLAAARSSPC